MARRGAEAGSSAGLRARRVAWDRLWYAEGGTLALALFRIAFAYCLWREVETTRSKSVYGIEGDWFHLPYLDFLPAIPSATFDWIHDVQYPLIVLVGVGLLMRPACASLFVLQGYVFFSDQLNFRNHPYFFLLLLLLLACSPADDALSIRALVRGWARRGPGLAASLLGGKRPLTFQRLMQFQVVVAYFFAGLHKLNAGFLSGDVVLENLLDDVDDWGTSLRSIAGDSGARLEDLVLSEPWLVAAAVATVVLELALPFGLLYRRTRPLCLVVGVLFHLSIAFLMSIRTFSMAMIASYLLFLDPETLPSLARRLLGLARRSVPGTAGAARRRSPRSAL